MTGTPWSDAAPLPFWLDSDAAPAPQPALAGECTCDLAIIGGGFTGLWAALHATGDQPGRDVVLLEGERVGWGASGRNGGFADASLTHGLPNGLERFPDEIEVLERLGNQNLAGMEADIARLSIDCAWESPGYLTVARTDNEVDELRGSVEVLTAHGHRAEWLDEAAARAQLDSPTYRGAVWQRSGAALVDPGRLAWGLRAACLDRGVRLHEGSPVTAIRELADGIMISTATGSLRARRVVLATNGYPPLLRSIRRHVVPVYDYVLVTEPLTAERRAAIGWHNRQGVSDAANQFHYYRLTSDDRVLWGGYDAVYYYGNGVRPELEQRDATFALLSQHFFETFPQLEGVRFSHRWGGVIDTCSRFCVMFDTAMSGRLSYAVGYTGLGVAATRFGARVALDLVDGVQTEATRLRFVRSKPVPFPPEPLRYAGIKLTVRELARADRNGGRRGLYLRALDRLGLGFDS